MRGAARHVATALALLSAGCFQHRLMRNAPGRVDLGSPPAEGSAHTPEEPSDPGDQAVIVSAGPMIAGGVAMGASRSIRGNYGLGLQAHATFAQFDRTILFPVDSTFPDRALGVGFGWTPLLEDDQRSRLYVELQGRFRPKDFLVLTGLAAGWTWEPGGSARGPQATASLGPLFLRGSFLSGRGTAIQLGLDLEPAFALVWSR